MRTDHSPAKPLFEDWQHASLTAFFHWQSQTVRTYQQQNTKKQQLASILNSTKLQKAGGKPGFHLTRRIIHVALRAKSHLGKQTWKNGTCLWTCKVSYEEI